MDDQEVNIQTLIDSIPEIRRRVDGWLDRIDFDMAMLSLGDCAVFSDAFAAIEDCRRALKAVWDKYEGTDYRRTHGRDMDGVAVR
jgi:hypothetical protein